MMPDPTNLELICEHLLPMVTVADDDYWRAVARKRRANTLYRLVHHLAQDLGAKATNRPFAPKPESPTCSVVLSAEACDSPR